MKISELSDRSGVPIPTIKFYIREGVLPPGERTAHNQAQYTDAHVSLLGLIRTLKDDLGLSIPTIARITAVDARRGSDFLSSGLATVAASRRQGGTLDRDKPEYGGALALTREIFARMGWGEPGSDTASEDTIAALMTLLRAWPEMFRIEIVERYARAAQDLAAFEIPDDWNPEAAPLESFKYAVLGTYLFEPVLLALRRVAQGVRAEALAAKHAAPPVKEPGRAPRKGAKRARRPR